MIAAALAPKPAWGARNWGEWNWGRHEALRRPPAGRSPGGLAFVLVKPYVHCETGRDLPPWHHGLAVLAAGGWLGWMLRPRPADLAPDDPRLGRRVFRRHSDGFAADGDGCRAAVR